MAALERSRLAEAARLNAERAAAEARRPPGETLTGRHCARCHEPERIAAAQHTRLGWSFTVARMRYLNDADIPAAEARVIVAHLASTQPAAPARALAEYGAALALPATALGWALLRRARRHRDTAGRTGTDRDAKTGKQSHV